MTAEVNSDVVADPDSDVTGGRSRGSELVLTTHVGGSDISTINNIKSRCGDIVGDGIEPNNINMYKRGPI